MRFKTINDYPEDEMWKLDVYFEDDDMLFQDKYGNLLNQNEVSELPGREIEKLGIREFLR